MDEGGQGAAAEGEGGEEGKGEEVVGFFLQIHVF